MNPQVKIVLTRFAKGLGAVVLAFVIQWATQQIPILVSNLPGLVNSPTIILVATPLLLALEKYLQGYTPPTTLGQSSQP